MIDISPSLLPLSDWSLPMGFRVVCHAPHMLACSSDIVSGGQNQNHNQEPALILLKKTVHYMYIVYIYFGIVLFVELNYNK